MLLLLKPVDWIVGVGWTILLPRSGTAFSCYAADMLTNPIFTANFSLPAHSAGERSLNLDLEESIRLRAIGGILLEEHVRNNFIPLGEMCTGDLGEFQRSCSMRFWPLPLNGNGRTTSRRWMVSERVMRTLKRDACGMQRNLDRELHSRYFLTSKQLLNGDRSFISSAWAEATLDPGKLRNIMQVGSVRSISCSL